MQKTKEHRLKLSLANKGKKRTPETLKRMSEAQKGEKGSNWKDGRTKNYSLEHRERVAGRRKPVECEICGAIGKICFDHDHNTGAFRGWICQRCNLVLGHVKDNIELLEALSNYLQK